MELMCMFEMRCEVVNAMRMIFVYDVFPVMQFRVCIVVTGWATVYVYEGYGGEGRTGIVLYTRRISQPETKVISIISVQIASVRVVSLGFRYGVHGRTGLSRMI